MELLFVKSAAINKFIIITMGVVQYAMRIILIIITTCNKYRKMLSHFLFQITKIFGIKKIIEGEKC